MMKTFKELKKEILKQQSYSYALDTSKPIGDIVDRDRDEVKSSVKKTKRKAK